MRIYPLLVERLIFQYISAYTDKNEYKRSDGNRILIYDHYLLYYDKKYMPFFVVFLFVISLEYSSVYIRCILNIHYFILYFYYRFQLSKQQKITNTTYYHKETIQIL